MRVGAHERWADMLDLFAGSSMARAAAEILSRPWRPEQSTAQPPIDCRHARIQDTRRGPACALCGAAPTVHADFYRRRGIP